MTQLPILHDGDTPEEPDPELRRAQLAERISDWLDRLSLDDDSARLGLSTGLASLVTALDEVDTLLGTALETDPARDPSDALHALDLTTELMGVLVGELRQRLAELEAAWPALEDRLLALAPEEDVEGMGDAAADPGNGA
jgi:hypothetical protein